VIVYCPRDDAFDAELNSPSGRLLVKTTTLWEPAMSFLIYLALFAATCGFGWWAKGNADITSFQADTERRVPLE
jgi:hypothetical protein